MSATTTAQDLLIDAIPDILGEIAAASIPATYTTVVYTATNALRAVFLKNNTNQSVYVSWDGSGVNNNTKLLGGQTQAVDLRTNGIYTRAKTQFFVKYASVAPTTNEVVIEGIMGT